MLLFLLSANLAGHSPEPRKVAQAFVKIERASIAAEVNWSETKTDGNRRREVYRVDEYGRRILLRLIEHE